jgi:hypothetical protein
LVLGPVSGAIYRHCCNDPLNPRFLSGRFTRFTIAGCHIGGYPCSCEPYTNIEVLAGGGAGSISYQASTASGSFTSGTFTIQPKTGDQLTVSIYYDQHGHDYFTVTDTTRHTTQTVKMTAVF